MLALRATHYAPLLPVAAAVTAGIVADRYHSVPVPLSFCWSILSLIAWSVCRRFGQGTAAMLPLWACCVGLGAAWHHAERYDFPADDIGELAEDEPSLLRVRGTVDEAPVTRKQYGQSPLLSQPGSERTTAVLRVTEVERRQAWRPASGKLRLAIEGTAPDVRPGDTVEVLGWLGKPLSPMNPGEFDFASRLLDRRIRAEMRIEGDRQAVVRLEEGRRTAFSRMLADVQSWGQRVIRANMPPSTAGIACALLLGDTSAMSQGEWDLYVRTGVIHVLAISGQHLVVLGGFVWIVLRVLNVSQRRSALIVAVLLPAYALLTGGRPSAMRAAIMVDAVCVGVLLRRSALPANVFALAWLAVLWLNPTDLFTAGFQLSFLCVAVLIWGIPRWFPEREWTPMELLIDESRPWPVRAFRGLVRVAARWYLITAVLTVATAPLVAWWQNVISPAGVVIGPPAILLTSIALISGFLMLPVSLLGHWAAWPFAAVTDLTLSVTEWLVARASGVPGGCWYVPDVPTWWLVGYYTALFAGLAGVRLTQATVNQVRQHRFVPRYRRSMLAAAIAVWACVGLVAGARRPATDELRMTFIALGHGGCTVIETPDGRVLLYDAGSMAGPEVARRHIAPFLWSRGIVRIDEVFISHADLDHFNALPALADRFVIGQVSWTPSFEAKPTPGVEYVVSDLRRRGIAVRILRAGDRFGAGGIDFQVLHPPETGPPGIENERSLVLQVEHRGRRILLTGDLERQGLEYLFDLPGRDIDVMMAPHHGSRLANPERWLDWARPQLVIACDRRPQFPIEDIYTRNRVPYWPTYRHGAITVRSGRDGMVAETFATGQRLTLAAR